MKAFMKTKVFGATQVSGTNREGVKYDFSRLYMVNPLESEITENRSVVSVGYSAEPIGCSDKVIRHLNEFEKSGGKFPQDFEVELTFTSNNGNQRFTATDIRDSAK